MKRYVWDEASKLHKWTFNGKDEDLTDSQFKACAVGNADGSFQAKAFTSKKEKTPSSGEYDPGYTQLCEAWLKFLLELPHGLDFPERHSYTNVLLLQEAADGVPNYQWPAPNTYSASTRQRQLLFSK